MENSALNAAHEKQRRAESLIRQGNYTEAAEFYQLAADFLSDAHAKLSINVADVNTNNFESMPSQFVLESLLLQRDYYNRQAAIVRMKQAQYDEYKMTLENQQKNILIKQKSKQEKLAPTLEKNEGNLKQEIYRTIEEQDNLLSLISLPNNEQAFKYPKDSVTVIEELKSVNYQLRSLVENLLGQLELKEVEIKQLKQRLEKISVAENNEICPLPPLAPLEMPLFDFTSS